LGVWILEVVQRNEAYTKTKAFEDHWNTDLAVKPVIYRFD
jgi:hypothetical protein